jgi:DNA-binding response OmpR family regulator
LEFILSEINKPQLVIVEDDERLAQLTSEFLTHNNFDVKVINRGDTAIEELPKMRVDAVILDLMLPGTDGIEVCKSLRTYFNGPILMLTAKGSDFDQVIGLEIGADDYVIKPVEPHVLLARVRALLRRTQLHSAVSAKDNNNKQAKDANDEQLTFDNLSINRQSRSVALFGQDISLTTREFQLLWLLASQAGTIISRDTILTQTRGLNYDGLDRTVDVRISKLRKKLGDTSEHPIKIKTIWGKGYLFVATAWQEN